MQTRRCARLIIINEQGQLLLFQYKDEHRAEPFWATAGGELTADESYRDAAQRELYEETGLTNPIGPLLKKHEAIFAVARSTPARWLEQYYLVECHSSQNIHAACWTEEEQETIQQWRWWRVAEMQAAGKACFKPEWLGELLNQVIKNGSKEQ